MQLLCNGVFVDLYEDTKIQFTHDNPLFAFDSLKCERTTQFKLPTTKKNDRIFALARIPAYPGEGMRRKFDAQLIEGQVIKNGYLYVSAYDGKDYAAVFVTGEMIGLQAIKNAGKISDILNPTTGIVWNAAHVQDANASAVYGAGVAIARYLTDAALCHPSYDLGIIMGAAYRSATGRSLSSYTPGFRVIQKEIKGIEKTTVQIAFAGTGAAYSESDEVTTAANTMTVDVPAVMEEAAQVLTVDNGVRESRYFSIRQLKPLQTISLTFPDDLPDDYFLMSIRDTGAIGADPVYNNFSIEWFLGDYSFGINWQTGQIERTGTPLAGRTVEIPTGTPFVLVRDQWLEYSPGGIGQPGHIYGFDTWSNAQYHIYNFMCTIEGTGIQPGDTIRVKDLLPDLTITDLLKIHAYLTGTVLNYTDREGVTFDTLDFDTWERVDITSKKMTEDEVRRVFSDYAQRNTIEFDSAGVVLSNTRVRTEYMIDNDNIDELKALAVIPFNEGELAVADGFVVPRFDAEDVEKNTLPKDGIFVATPQGGRYGQRIALTPNANLQALCDASTQIQVSARMTLYEYDQITPKTLIYVDGTEYVWTSRNWQNNVAEFTLAKIQ